MHCTAGILLLSHMVALFEVVVAPKLVLSSILNGLSFLQAPVMTQAVFLPHVPPVLPLLQLSPVRVIHYCSTGWCCGTLLYCEEEM